jgi:predicted phosphatase
MSRFAELGLIYIIYVFYVFYHTILSLIMYFGVQVVKHHPWTSQVLVQMMHMVRGRICYNLTL